MTQPPGFPALDFANSTDLPPAERDRLNAQVKSGDEFLARVDWRDRLHWQPNDRQLQLFSGLYRALLVGNRSQNLTRITDPDAFWEKHLWDSLRGLMAIGSLDELSSHECRAIDIGTGAGFPGLPMAIACPQWHVTLLDSTRKKIAFVASAIESLSLENARAIAERSEAFGQTQGERESYDLATLRAIGSAVVCAEYALPLVNVGGRVILYRGQWTEAETEALSEVAEMLGGAIASIDAFETPLTHSVRHGIVLEKRSPTPKAYPRLPGIPNRHPLGSEPQR